MIRYYVCIDYQYEDAIISNEQENYPTIPNPDNLPYELRTGKYLLLPPVPCGQTYKDGWVYSGRKFAEIKGSNAGTLKNNRGKNKGGMKTENGLFGMDKDHNILGNLGIQFTPVSTIDFDITD